MASEETLSVGESGKDGAGIQHSKCKGPGAHPKKSNQASVFRVKQVKRVVVGEEAGDVDSGHT